jgi:hypothetical protein
MDAIIFSLSTFYYWACTLQSAFILCSVYSVTKYADGSVKVSYSIGFEACILISDIIHRHCDVILEFSDYEKCFNFKLI